MPDNDNDPLSDTEKQLINFINTVRPESGHLLKSREATERWLRRGKFCATLCGVSVFDSALLGGWHGLSAIAALIGAAAPLLMILTLERLLGQWKGRIAWKRGRPIIRWHFERAQAGDRSKKPH